MVFGCSFKIVPPSRAGPPHLLLLTSSVTGDKYFLFEQIPNEVHPPHLGYGLRLHFRLLCCTSPAPNHESVPGAISALPLYQRSLDSLSFVALMYFILRHSLLLTSNHDFCKFQNHLPEYRTLLLGYPVDT